MTLTRTRLKMPDFIRDALTERKLMDAYHARPDYQQNDYLGWITRAKRDATKEKRLAQMLDELEGGKLYMSTLWTKRHTLFYSHFIENLSTVVELFSSTISFAMWSGPTKGEDMWFYSSSAVSSAYLIASSIVIA